MEPLSSQRSKELCNGEKSRGLVRDNVLKSADRVLSAAPMTIVLKPVRRHRRLDAFHGDLSLRMRVVCVDELRDVLGRTVQARPDEDREARLSQIHHRGIDS